MGSSNSWNQDETGGDVFIVCLVHQSLSIQNQQLQERKQRFRILSASFVLLAWCFISGRWEFNQSQHYVQAVLLRVHFQVIFRDLQPVIYDTPVRIWLLSGSKLLPLFICNRLVFLRTCDTSHRKPVDIFRPQTLYKYKVPNKHRFS